MLTVTAMMATGMVPQAIAEAINEGTPAAESITDIVMNEQKEDEEPAYITGEVEELRTKYSKTYEQSDGSRIAVMSAAPVHFYDEKTEEWKEYDNRLKYNEETDAYESEETGSDMQVVLPEKIDEQKEIEVEAGGYKVSVNPIDIKSEASKKINEQKKVKSENEESLKEYSLEDYVSDAVLDGKVEYTQDESVKVEYIFSGSGLKENIVLSEVPEKGQTYSFGIKAEGLTAKLKKDNTVKLLDSENKEIFEIPAPYMYDGEFEFSDKIKTTLEEENGEYILTYEPDNEWLSAEERAYPVTIDPTIDTKPSRYTNAIVDTSTVSVMQSNLSKNVHLFAGAGGNRNATMDAYIKFGELPVVEDSWMISKAELKLKTADNKDNKINAYKVTSDWDVSTVYKTAPEVSSTILDVCNVPAEKDAEVSWDITNTVYDWYNGKPNYGIKLSSPYAQNNQSVFYSVEAADSDKIPYLSVEYTTISKAQLENSRSVDIGRAGTAVINDFSGNVVLTREDIGVDGNVMPVNISMIYNLNDLSYDTFGTGFRTNYNQIISYETDESGNKYYEYICEDGSTVYFDENTETEDTENTESEDAEKEKYIDRSDRGYTIKVNEENENDLQSVVITDSSDYEYGFDKDGRLIKITNTQSEAEEKPSINIVYTDNTKSLKIDYITDGAITDNTITNGKGRKYKFNYTNGKLTDISYYGNTSIVLKKVSYEYDSYSNLKKVTYPDGKSVKYNYGNHCLVSAYNTDNYNVNFSYDHYTPSPKANRVTEITEYGSSGTKGADISVSYTPYETKYTNKITGDTETLVFSSEGDLISTFNSEGYVTVNEYAKSSEVHGVSSLVHTYEHKKSETNLVSNGEFEEYMTDWIFGDDTAVYFDASGHPGNAKSLRLIGDPYSGQYVTQDISITGKKGDTFDIGGWAKANASPQNPFNIVAAFINNGTFTSAITIDFNPYCTDWQYLMKSMEAPSNFTAIRIVVNYHNQINEALFDGIAVYRGEPAEETEDTSGETTTEPEEPTEPEPTTSIGSDFSVTTTEENDGVTTVSVVDKYGNDLSSETIIDGMSLSNSNEYTSNGNYQAASTDALGKKTLYGYDENLGNLRNVTDPKGSKVYYNYDKNGNITDVYQYVTGLSNQPAIINTYAYDSGDRLSKITHNDFDYDFGYSEFGLLESISAGNQNLISYGYDNQGTLTYADYGNGQSIDYEYNDNGSYSAVKQDGQTLYSYSYDADGALTSIQDNVSDRETKYTTDSDGNSVVEETGEVYHKFYSKDNEAVEVIGNNTKKTKTVSDENQNKTYWTVNNSVYSTYLTKTDKFGRTEEESLYKTSLDTDGKEVENTKNEVYTKGYSYTSIGNKTSEQISDITYSGSYNNNIHYEYDDNGNITAANDVQYSYDEAGQLTKELNSATDSGKEYVYDKGGNIVSVKHIENGEETETDTYTYGNSNWKDLLTEYNGNEITYDEIGNPLTYYDGTKFSWTMGRRLESVRKGNARISYKYNADGLRTSKTINGIKFSYFWNGSKLTAQTWLGNTIYFYYDNNGVPIGFDYNYNHYYYVTNLQGDIIAILDSNGTCVAEYSYDAWGNYTIVTNKDSIANINPLRYRGYYYDSDTNLYYLQSRYYDSNIGRFISADDGQMLFENPVRVNLFSYCYNNYINYIDFTGYKCLKAKEVYDLRRETWLCKQLLKLKINFELDKKYYIANKSRLGVKIKVYLVASYSTNKLGLLSISEKDLSISFHGISLGVGWGRVSASISSNVKNHSVRALFQKSFSKETKAISISYNSKKVDGLKIAMVVSLSINNLSKLAAKAIIAGAIVATPELVGVLTSVGSGWSATALFNSIQKACGY